MKGSKLRLFFIILFLGFEESISWNSFRASLETNWRFGSKYPTKSRRVHVFRSSILQLYSTENQIVHGDDRRPLEILKSTIEDENIEHGVINGGDVTRRSSWWVLLQRRMWTKMDFLHIHAISGVVYSGIGLLWLANLFYWQAVQGESFSGTIGLGALILLFAGAVNCISCIPMSRFKPMSAESDLKGDGFKNLGVGMTMLCIWLSFWFSGYYPSLVHVLDIPLSIVSLGTIFWGIQTSELALTETMADLKRSPQKYKGESVMDIVINHRIASYPNLFHLPCLYNVLFGREAWYLEMSEKFPMQPVLLFHACFALGVANSIVFLGATLKDRSLMTLRQWLYLQIIVLLPFITTVVDLNIFKERVTINPFELYAGFI